MPKPNLTPRLEAISILTQVLQHNRSLTQFTFQHPFTQELCYGTLRFYFSLEKLLSLLLSKPIAQLKEQNIEIYLLLLIGLYQLIYLDLAPYAAVAETVETAKHLNKPWAVTLVNAILRTYLREKINLQQKISYDSFCISNHPEWLYQRIRKAWQEKADDIFKANNSRPPFTLRVNLLRAKREDYLPGELAIYNTCGITLSKAVNVNDLPGFSKGKVSLQDGAAQFAAGLLDLKPGLTILDACAAPGGKTAHILETEPKLKKVVALDNDNARLNRVKENLMRLGLNATLVHADAATWQSEEYFDRILLDAPCSATGVIRRHPDIKFLRREEDIAQYVKQQASLLQHLWSLLKPGGLLVYATCSILPEENSEIIKDFFSKNKNAAEKIIEADWGIKQPFGRQILPGMQNMDGFYYCCVQKA